MSIMIYLLNVTNTLLGGAFAQIGCSCEETNKGRYVNIKNIYISINSELNMESRQGKTRTCELFNFALFMGYFRAVLNLLVILELDVFQ